MTNLPTISAGATGPTVEWAQYLLLTQGLLSLAQIDGDFGPQTKTAVEQFQRQFDLSVDGVVGPATWAALGGNGPQPPVLAQGSRGPVVELLQRVLNEGRGQFLPASEPALAVDGDYGPATAAVIRVFQKQGGVPVDGVVGLKTWAIQVSQPIATSLALLCGLPGPGGP